MMQFIGLSYVVDPDGVRAVSVVVDRKAVVLGTSSAPVGGVSRNDEGVILARGGEWLRAGSLALKDAFFQVPGKTRRVWGFALAGPPGRVALDPSLEPLGELRICPRPREDLLAWLAAHPRLVPHFYAVLAPKDYFRYAVSGALATDVTQAETFGWLLPGTTRWSSPELERAGPKASWFPPIFDSTVATGSISEDGMRRTGLPGGLWVVAGSLSGAGSLISAGDLRAGSVLASATGSGLQLEALASGLDEPAPSGFETLRAPVAGHRLLRRTVPLGPGSGATDPAAAARGFISDLERAAPGGLAPPERLLVDYRTATPPPWAAELLAGTGVPAALSPFAGGEDPGIAYFAGIAHGAYRNWDDLYRKLREARGAEGPGAREAGKHGETSA